MKLDGKNAEPLYIQLVNSIQRDINSGKYPAGTRLPSESELSTLYDVSRITVRSALKYLSEQGSIIRRQGKGTYVLQRKLKRNLSLASSFTDACREIGKVAGAKLVASGIKPASPSDQVDLELEEGDQVVYIQRLRYADGIPVSVEEDRFPIRFAFLLEENLDNTSMLSVLKEKYDISFQSKHRTIELVYAPQHISALLNCPPETPMLYIVSAGLEKKLQTPGQRSLQYVLGDSFKLYI